MTSLLRYLEVAPARITARFDPRPGPLDSWCIVWTGRTVNGYASARWNGPERKLHRALYLELVGPVPDGLVLDHLCRNRACVNVDHLEPVTQRTNIRRGAGLAAAEAQRTHCPSGHPYDETNTYSPPSRPNARYCKTCRRAHQRAYRARRAA